MYVTICLKESRFISASNLIVFYVANTLSAADVVFLLLMWFYATLGKIIGNIQGEIFFYE